MNKEISKKIDEIIALCKKYNVKKLELIGSAATGKFNKKRSDIDFLIEFNQMTPAEHSNSYFLLLEELQDLFQRHIDLIEICAVENPHFLESVEKERNLLYAA
jgi:predicted nucleotidyltransferase